jgi:hypothetical protein
MRVGAHIAIGIAREVVPDADVSFLILFSLRIASWRCGCGTRPANPTQDAARLVQAEQPQDTRPDPQIATHLQARIACGDLISQPPVQIGGLMVPLAGRRRLRE